MTPQGIDLPLRLFFFFLVFVILAFGEVKSQRFPLTQDKGRRWLNHFGLSFAGAVLVRAFLPMAGVSVAWFAQGHRIGLFHQILLPSSVALALSLLNLDWALYYQHRALHAFAPLWKFHRVHHTDMDFDISTGLRFHFLETAFTLAVKAAVILALGCPPAAVLLFELTYMTAVLFGHANFRLAPWIEKPLRLLWVTPYMHRIHHSTGPADVNRNFGFIFSWWDRGFGTYRAKPQSGEEAGTIGLETYRDPFQTDLPNLLLQPFMDPEQNISLKNFKTKETAYTQGPGA